MRSMGDNDYNTNYLNLNDYFNIQNALTNMQIKYSICGNGPFLYNDKIFI